MATKTSKKILVYGDSNGWGLLDELGDNIRCKDRWPHTLRKNLKTKFEKNEIKTELEIVEEWYVDEANIESDFLSLYMCIYSIQLL